MSISCFVVRLFLIISLIFFVTLRIDLEEGLIISFPLNLRKFHPRKSNPLFICVITVFSIDNVSPLSLRKLSSICLMASSVSLSDAVTMKSSANRTICTLWLLYFTPNVFLTLLLQYTFRIMGSIPSSTMFAYVGDITPPCGDPSVVG